jgi:hypothetical protein
MPIFLRNACSDMRRPTPRRTARIVPRPVPRAFPAIRATDSCSPRALLLPTPHGQDPGPRPGAFYATRLPAFFRRADRAQ